MALPNLNTDHSDISTWGIAAMVCGAIAIVSVNLGALVPENIVSALHASRLEGGNVNQLRTGMAEVRAENLRLTRDTRALLSRFNLLDDDSGEVIRRLAAVERSLPLLIESLPLDADIDRSLLTASIAATSPEVYEADGGIIIVRQSALFEDVDASGPGDQPMPPPLGDGYGVALGNEVLRQSVSMRRSEILTRSGPMLNELAFVMGETNELDKARIIAGPLADYEAAHILCEPLTAMGIACEPVPFVGEDWPD
ncbi:hypothetical protein [Pelagibacterium sediminicola]|uniref:hypothetical protein n=1 Tax=Pelagibacterium sediminicola TaxID=2248761 RepID=UPI00130092BB|nr:hypothetical protein [Pelagibacterium sediminicola]